ncbi:MAG: T9SS type A sorting domain-containing protein [Candidatus Marinimicrobia bacterium]|nr:T9SS type A sorting domain-containing protein [Candidatus Neomarinimicrobiota bacterium]
MYHANQKLQLIHILLIIGLLLFLLVFAPKLLAQELEYDDHTLLLLHFNDNTLDSEGKTPIVATADSFEPGIFGNGLRLHRSATPYFGDSLYFEIPSDYDPSEGTVEFWLSPRWIGDEYIFMQAFNMDEIRVQINTPGLFCFFMLQPDNESGYQPIEHWQETDWHHIAVTWKIPGRMRLYIDGFEKVNNAAGTLDLVTNPSGLFRIGGVLPSNNMSAVFDEFRFSNIEKSAKEIAASLLSADFQIDSLKMERTEIRLQTDSDFKPVIRTSNALGLEYFPNAALQWTVADTSIATIDENGVFYGKNPGETTFYALYDTFNLSGTISVDKILMEPETLMVDTYLGSLPDQYIWEKPVLVVEYVPMQDSLNAEPNSASDAFTLAHMNTRLDVYNRRVKYMMQEGTRYHGYKNPSAIPSIGFRIIERIRIYEHMPMSKKMCGWHENYYYPDYQKVTTRINAENYVNERGVREIWIWYSGYEINGLGYELPESNMSSPTTGDISNSARDNTDLPVYDHTYILYQFDWALTHGYAVHNQGHQLESMMGYVNQRQDGNEHLFFRKFCGMDKTDTWITGRCGWTHMAPNSDQHYHYDDTNHVWSDCEDWTPEKTGELKWVNVDTWKNLEYQWPEEPQNWTPETSPYHINWARAEVNFYIYWRQNWPGYNNNIPYGTDKRITNWWQFLGDWDEAVKADPKLYEYLEPQQIETEQLPDKFKVYPNFPNPFNNSTLLRFDLPVKGNVMIEIFNLTGQKSAVLKNETMEAGQYSVLWEPGGNLPSGIYYIKFRLKADDIEHQWLGKAVLLK